MKTFGYVIKDELGIHARPAGMLAKLAKNYKSEILLHKGDKKANCTKLMAVMALGIKCGDEVVVTVDGTDETEAEKEIQKFIKTNF